jgi:hypothetical protein
MRSITGRRRSVKRLICPKCGKSERFLEVVSMESHIVDEDFNYVELVDSWPDHYTCCKCMTVVLEGNFRIE